MLSPMTGRLALLNACAMSARSRLPVLGEIIVSKPSMVTAQFDDNTTHLQQHSNRRLTPIYEQAPKKEKKDLDDEDKAFLERKRAGTLPPFFRHTTHPSHAHPKQNQISNHFANAFQPEQQRRRPARSSPPRPAARVPSTPVLRASRSPARSKE